ncbi:MAG: hypothetical protein ABSG03_04695 [Bryobacteraceae bacterium]|jgi:hypothetical protein
MEKHPFHLDAGESKEFRIVLTPDTLRQTENVAAKADPFETSRGDCPDAITLAGNDAKNLGSLLADDPLPPCRVCRASHPTTISKRASRCAAPTSAASDSIWTASCSMSRSTWSRPSSPFALCR